MGKSNTILQFFHNVNVYSIKVTIKKKMLRKHIKKKMMVMMQNFFIFIRMKDFNSVKFKGFIKILSTLYYPKFVEIFISGSFEKKLSKFQVNTHQVSFLNSNKSGVVLQKFYFYNIWF